MLNSRSIKQGDGNMGDIVIVEAVRTPLGRRNGWLREVHPARLGAIVVGELLQRTQLDPALIDHVLFGCVSQAGEQAFNIARNVVLDAGLPVTAPATSLDFQCGSSQQAAHLGAGMIVSGQAEIVIAGGVESMTRVPLGSSALNQQPFTDRIIAAYHPISQGMAADKIAAKWNITRAEADLIGYESHVHAAQATEKGWFQREMAPVDGLDDAGQPLTVTRDQGIRFNPDLGKMGQLAPAFSADGVTTAGNSSQITDGAAAVLLMRAQKAAELGLKPRARIVAMVTTADDPYLMLTGPIGATKKALTKANKTINDIDLFEVNEAFAVVIAMWQREIGADMTKVNAHGGAIALGHPVGASGARLMTTLLYALETHDKRFGLQTMCCGGGLGTGTVIERLD